jgi:hypothetical protein
VNAIIFDLLFDLWIVVRVVSTAIDGDSVLLDWRYRFRGGDELPDFCVVDQLPFGSVWASQCRGEGECTAVFVKVEDDRCCCQRDIEQAVGSFPGC